MASESRNIWAPDDVIVLGARLVHEEFLNQVWHSQVPMAAQD